MNEIERIDTLEHEGKLAEARDLLLQLVARYSDDKPAESAVLLARASELTLYVDGPERGAELAAEACERAEVSGDASAVAQARIALATVHLRQHTDTALDDAKRVLDSIETDGLPEHLRAHEAHLRGLVAARRGRPREALERFAQSYQLGEGSAELRARVLLTWAVQLRNWGLFSEAERRAERSLELRLQLGDHYGAAMCYGVLAFIYQRQGQWQRERDALAADLRECERIGGTADMPSLHTRLAGALVGLGKYAGAWAEAESAIDLESARLKLVDVTVESATRVHGFAWREQARVCLAQGRLDEGIDLVRRAAAVFANVRDAYGESLCHLSEAELSLEQVRGGIGEAAEQCQVALAAARPVFVRLGAVPEAVETILVEVELATRHGADRGEEGAARIVQQVLPMLQQAGLGASDLFRRAREVAERVSPGVALDRVVNQAAMLRSLAAIVVETEPQEATVVAVRAGGEARALGFARSAVDRGAVVLWPDSEIGVAVLLGDRHQERAQKLLAEVADLAVATAEGTVDLEHMWPAGVRARGSAVDEVIAELTGAGQGTGKR